MNKFKQVKVEWEDSCHNPGWVKNVSEARLSRCQSIGFLVRKDHKIVLIAQSVSDLDNMSEILAIPRGCVKHIQIVK